MFGRGPWRVRDAASTTPTNPCLFVPWPRPPPCGHGLRLSLNTCPPSHLRGLEPTGLASPSVRSLAHVRLDARLHGFHSFSTVGMEGRSPSTPVASEGVKRRSSRKNEGRRHGDDGASDGEAHWRAESFAKGGPGDGSGAGASKGVRGRRGGAREGSAGTPGVGRGRRDVRVGGDGSRHELERAAAEAAGQQQAHPVPERCPRGLSRLRAGRIQRHGGRGRFVLRCTVGTHLRRDPSRRRRATNGRAASGLSLRRIQRIRYRHRQQLPTKTTCRDATRHQWDDPWIRRRHQRHEKREQEKDRGATRTGTTRGTFHVLQQQTIRGFRRGTVGHKKL
eukprot:scaffold116_cov334-Pavlova_lutheri.AAC.24